MSTDPRAETIRLLTSIDASLKALLARGNGGESPVNDRVCDGPHGDPIIKAKDPRDWTGEAMKGRHFSECPPDYLDLLAERYDYFAEKSNNDAQSASDEAELQDAQKSLRYAKLDAARARGWAARLRAGWTAPVPVRGDHEPDW